MGQTIDIYPNASGAYPDADNESDLSPIGAATLHEAANASLSSYIERDSGTAFAYVWLRFTNLSAQIPAGAHIEWLQVWYYGRATGKGTRHLWSTELKGYRSGTPYSFRFLPGFLPNSGIAQWRGSPPVDAAGGVRFDDMDIDSFAFKLGGAAGDGADEGQVFIAKLRVSYNEAPTVTATAPTGTVSTTSTPPVQWVYADAENDPQRAWHVRIYDSTTHGAGGFDVDDTDSFPPIVDSGERSGGAREWTPDVPLPDGDTYYCYVRARQADVAANAVYSAWDSTSFTLAVTPPGAPTVDATAAPATFSVTVDVDKGAGGDPDYFVLQRSDDGGVTWGPVRDGAQIAYQAGGAAVVDWELPRGVGVTYRARAQENQISSDWTTDGPVQVPATGWRLIDPLDPAGALHSVSVAVPLRWSRPRPQTVIEGLGSEVVTVSHGGTRGVAGTLNIWAKDEATYTKVIALIEGDRTWLLQDPFGRQWYLARSGDVTYELIHAAPGPGETTPIRHMHAFSVDVAEVASGISGEVA